MTDGTFNLATKWRWYRVVRRFRLRHWAAASLVLFHFSAMGIAQETPPESTVVAKVESGGRSPSGTNSETADESFASNELSQSPDFLNLVGDSVAGADEPMTESSGAAQAPMHLAGFRTPVPAGKSVATPEMTAWLTRLIRQNLPPTYEDDKHWGETKEVWNGVRLRREGLRVETERRIRTVNTGTWTRYKIDIVEPEKNLQVQFHQLEALENGDITFYVTVDCSLDCFGRLSQWVRDVQVISISVNADAAVRLSVVGTVGVQMNFFKFPPDLTVQPKVDQAHVELTHYRVRRISQVGGDFAKVLGNGLRSVVDQKLENFNGKLVEKMNKQIEKQADKLSFSPHDWLKAKLPIKKSPSE